MGFPMSYLPDICNLRDGSKDLDCLLVTMERGRVFVGSLIHNPPRLKTYHFIGATLQDGDEGSCVEVLSRLMPETCTSTRTGATCGKSLDYVPVDAAYFKDNDDSPSNEGGDQRQS